MKNQNRTQIIMQLQCVAIHSDNELEHIQAIEDIRERHQIGYMCIINGSAPNGKIHTRTGRNTAGVTRSHPSVRLSWKARQSCRRLARKTRS